MRYTHSNYRIENLSDNQGYDWLFLPGGPGLGSAYLKTLIPSLELKGSCYLIDFPQDGDNKKGTLNLESWRSGLIELLQLFENPLLVTHSFSGMFALTIPELEDHLTGLVLLNTTPIDSFFSWVSTTEIKYKLPSIMSAINNYN